MVRAVDLYKNNEITENNQRTQRRTAGTDFSQILNDTMKTGKKTEQTGMDAIFQKASDKYDVPQNLLKAVAKAESGFNAKAVSHCGAQGVMQLMPQTAKALGVTDSFDAEQNIMGGAKYLSQMLDKYDGNTKLALAAYNAGSGNVAKYGGIPPFKETQNYVVKVTKYMNEGVNAPKTPVESSSSSKESVQNGTNANRVIYTPIVSNDTASSTGTSDNPDDIFSYSDYLKLVNELKDQMQMLYLERNMNIVNMMSEKEEPASAY